MRHFSSILTSAVLLIGGTFVKADIIIPAGTTIQGVDTGDVDNPGFGISVNQSTNIFTFTKAVNCADITTFSTTSSEAGDALTTACNKQAGSYLGENNDGSVNLGKGNSTITLDSEGISQDGKNLIKQKSNGELHIGENSWITKEEDGVQKVYAKDAVGNPIPIDYTNGTKLLINGRDVEQAIDNVGALSAALTGLPTVPQDSPMACGIGTGTHSNNFAFSGGCASRINEKLAFNVAASFVPGQQYQGNFDSSWSGRAGFVFKLGKVNKPSLISMNDKKAIKSSNKELKEIVQKQSKQIAMQNEQIAMQNARLEKLERIALANQSDQQTVTSFLNLSNLFSTMRSLLISSN